MLKRTSVKFLNLAKPSQLLRSSRSFAAAAPPPKQERREEQASSSSSSLLWLGVAALAAGGGYYYYDQQQKPLDYQKVYNAIASKLDSPDYDDGSLGPVLVRLAWHASGTYDKETKTGGSHGATMRFDPESSHGANAGLAVARNFLEQFKKQFPKISYADLWSLAGVVAIQEMGGPVIKWRPGRADLTADLVTPDGRLPDATKTQSHLRDIFYRMGFNDQEIVALSGAHALGRCHTDRSGFKGPWVHLALIIDILAYYFDKRLLPIAAFRKVGSKEMGRPSSVRRQENSVLDDASFRLGLIQ